MEPLVLITDNLLSNESFRTDLCNLLNQDPSVLLALADVADHREGFSQARASILQARTGVTTPQASRLMYIARYLYDRVTAEAIPVPLAVDQLCGMGADIIPAVNEEMREALMSLLTYKGHYERGQLAKIESLGSGPHYEGINGRWTISIHKTRENEVVKNVVLHLSVTWHDGRGTSHEAFFSLTSDQWQHLQGQMEDISKEYSDLQEYLNG